MGRARAVNDQQGEFFMLSLSDPRVPSVGKMHRFPTPSEKLAALQVMPRTGTQRMRILQHIANAGWRGATSGEIEVFLHMRQSSIAGRLNDLEQGGWIHRNGEKRPAPNTGAPNDVWILTERGQKEVPAIT